LISAIPERVLRECLNAFEKIVDIVENPQEIRQKYGSFNVNLKIIFGDEEIKMFERWVSEKRLKICGIPEKIYTFTHLAIAFLIGWWLGDDQKDF
ncbi:MAG: hypothetical protein N3A62_06210, partial [Thermodesulfovibrionales bacterium]|nr:hypothetical protein [Thermodesulfovibrionales bacterium]